MVTPSGKDSPNEPGDEPVAAAAEEIIADDSEAVKSFDILSELLGSDTDSVDLDALFDAVLVAGSDDAELVDADTTQPPGGESDVAQTRIVTGGSIDDMLNGMTDTNAPDMTDLGVGGNLDPFNPET
jgi:hypothetical protein